MNSLLDKGIYTIPEAARLTHVSTSRIRRWLRGYEFQAKHGRHRSPAVWHGQLEPVDHTMALGFLDLLEIRCVDAFLQAGVSWKELRRAHCRAREVLHVSHPFCTERFGVDGRVMILEMPQDGDEPQLWEIAKDQKVFRSIVSPFLKGLEFHGSLLPSRWWPLGQNRHVALDPRRKFGQPILFEHGIPTRVLARSVIANGSIKEVARWYEIEETSVREAVAFEQTLAA